MEEWKEIPRFKGLYLASSQGRIKSITRFMIEDWKYGQRTVKYTGKVLSPYKRHGYLAIDVAGKIYSAHRLILEAFVGPCPEGMECCHNNGNPSDNRLENLRWDTKKENANDKIKHGTAENCIKKGESHGMSKLTEEQVREIWYLGDTNLTLEQIGDKFNVTKHMVHRILTSQNWTHITEKLPKTKKRMRGNTRYTDEQRADMLKKAQSGIKGSVIAREYGCSRSYINKMLRASKND